MSDISTVLQEHRVFAPPPDFAKKAHIGSLEQYRALCAEAAADGDAFWAARAKEELHWQTPFGQVLDWKPPHARWFLGGTTNLAFNCLDRHLPKRAAQEAIRFEGEPGEVRVLTYQQLFEQVCRLANALKALGVKAGDRVGIYLPMVPEAAIAMLACARIGAVHSVVFGGFSAEALRDRLADAGATVLLTADGGYRKGAVVPLLANARAAKAAGIPTLQHTVVFQRLPQAPALVAGEHDWAALCARASADCPPTWVDSEHPLFILYTSGSTGKPKGVLHTTGGYSVWASLTTRWVFDLHEGDRYFCTADVGWVTGHSYVVYGPLLNGTTTVIYEGAPTTPGPDRLWQLIAAHQVNVFYTAPTAIRAFMRLGDEHPRKHDLSSLRLLGSVGEPINPEAWMWYRDVIGQGRCPVVDTWWQTETGGILISPLPGATPTKPGSATLPLPGIFPEVLDQKGNRVEVGAGKLFVTRPWPSMLRTVWGDDERFQKTYFAERPGLYFTGDGARRDADGYFWVIGRVDDVVNVAGHRLGTAEIESALVSHGKVAEAAVVGRPDALKGTALVCFVTVKASVEPSEALAAELKAHVAKEIGAFARPDDLRFAAALPKTRSGKIMRRLLRDVAAGQDSKQDTTTLEDLSVLAALRQDDE
ncbi:MAG: acetate--CoA ligase [Myxococcaceae bacterium]|nr:acetate--CoA ligase [Myxococcaceae bacterium]